MAPTSGSTLSIGCNLPPPPPPKFPFSLVSSPLQPLALPASLLSTNNMVCVTDEIEANWRQLPHQVYK